MLTQSYKTEMDALESQESITLKIQSLNAQRSEINQQIEDNNFQLREMGEERQRYNDIVRYLSFILWLPYMLDQRPRLLNI